MHLDWIAHCYWPNLVQQAVLSNLSRVPRRSLQDHGRGCGSHAPARRDAQARRIFSAATQPCVVHQKNKLTQAFGDAAHACQSWWHRDIKPENFLLTDKTDRARLKLCDFGLSSYWKPGVRLQSIVGSCYYVAPEVTLYALCRVSRPLFTCSCTSQARLAAQGMCMCVQVLRRDYGVEADMWSLGVMLYILLSGLPPFWGDTEEDIFRMVLKVPPWSAWSGVWRLP